MYKTIGILQRKPPLRGFRVLHFHGFTILNYSGRQLEHYIWNLTQPHTLTKDQLGFALIYINVALEHTANNVTYGCKTIINCWEDKDYCDINVFSIMTILICKKHISHTLHSLQLSNLIVHFDSCNKGVTQARRWWIIFLSQICLLSPISRISCHYHNLRGMELESVERRFMIQGWL